MNAIQLCSIHFTQSKLYVDCLYYLGILYKDMNRFLEAEELLMKAIQLYSTNFPHSEQRAHCLMTLGMLYGSNELIIVALEKLEEARELFVRMGNQKALDDCDHALQFFRNN